jgi:hypothetical protein
MRREIKEVDHGEILLLDSIGQARPDDAGRIVVCGSHGGSIDDAIDYGLAAVFLNDAGGGKRDAGIAALAVLDTINMPAGTVDCWSARIGDADDTWRSGVVSHLNQTATHLGLQVGLSLQPQLLTHQSSIFALCGNDVHTKRTKP